jgi:hypothetical protein
LHWSDISGGVQSHANRDYLCGYVWCNAAVEGAVSHSCQHGEGPHHIKVCVVKKDNAKSTYASLLALMDWECNLTRCPFVVDLGDLSGNLVDQWLHQHRSPDACVKVDFGWWKSAAGWSRKGHPKVRRFGSRASRTQKLLRPTSTRGCCITRINPSTAPLLCIFGGSGRTGPSASRSCAAEAFRNSLPRSLPVRRRDSGACQDTRRFRKHCATTSSTLSAYPDSILHHEAQPNRTAEVRDPYARWCGRGGAARHPPIPIFEVSPTLRHATMGAKCQDTKSLPR